MTTASYFKTPGGRAGIQDTLRRMRDIVHKSVRDPRLIALARQLTAKLKARDYAGEIKTLFEWVRDNIRYAKDIEGVETLIEPADLVFNLELGRQGDCDDFSMLLATLLKIMGHRARFKAGTVAGARQGHVWVEVFLDNKWIPLDAIYQNNSVGYCPPNMGNFITVSVEGYEEDSMAGTEKDYVRLAVQDGKVVGMGLTKEAIEQLKKELPNMDPNQIPSALRIIAASEKSGSNLSGYIGAADSGDSAVLTTAVAVDPTGLLGKGIAIGKVFKSLFGGGSKADADRKAVQSGFLAKWPEMQAAINGMQWSPMIRPTAGQDVINPKIVNLQEYKDYMAALKAVLDSRTAIGSDTSKSASVAWDHVGRILGTGAYADQAKFGPGHWVTLTNAYAALLLRYTAGDSKPTTQDIAVVANGLVNSTDPNSQALGNGIVNAQNQTYPTYPENTEIPAGAISIVGEYMGATTVRTVQPGDRVQKGETITSNVPIVIKNGVVVKSAGTIFGLPKNIVYIAGSSLAAAAVATGVIIMVKSKKGK